MALSPRAGWEIIYAGADRSVPQGLTSKPLRLTPCIKVSRLSCLNIKRVGWGGHLPSHLRLHSFSPQDLKGLLAQVGGGQTTQLPGGGATTTGRANRPSESCRRYACLQFPSLGPAVPAFLVIPCCFLWVLLEG